MTGEKIEVFVLDENGVHFFGKKDLKNMLDFDIKNPYENVVFLLKKGVELSQNKINRIFLESAQK